MESRCARGYGACRALSPSPFLRIGGPGGVCEGEAQGGVMMLSASEDVVLEKWGGPPGEGPQPVSDRRRSRSIPRTRERGAGEGEFFGLGRSGLVAQSVRWIEVFLQIIEGALRRSLVFVISGREKKRRQKYCDKRR